MKYFEKKAGIKDLAGKAVKHVKDVASKGYGYGKDVASKGYGYGKDVASKGYEYGKDRGGKAYEYGKDVIKSNPKAVAAIGGGAVGGTGGAVSDDENRALRALLGALGGAGLGAGGFIAGTRARNLVKGLAKRKKGDTAFQEAMREVTRKGTMERV
jgi:hypothetical protein